MQTVFSIVGPTATGKTQLALLLASHFLEQSNTRVHLISADSRQVYQGLEVLTGADVPDGFNLETTDEFAYPFYQKGRVLIHGISLVKPSEEWSVSHFRELALPIISRAQEKSELVIIVGGTGLYHDQLFSEDAQLDIAPNLEIRQQASRLSVLELQDWLKKVSPSKLNQLNHSDLYNPRRLVRAIEIAHSSQRRDSDVNANPKHPPQNHLYLGVTAPLEIILEKITARVNKRFLEALGEVEKILNRDTDGQLAKRGTDGQLAKRGTDGQPTTRDTDSQSTNQTTTSQPIKQVKSTLGFKQLASFLSDQASKSQAIESWILQEFRYAKRQLTWWKKHPNITWVESSAVSAAVSDDSDTTSSAGISTEISTNITTDTSTNSQKQVAKNLINKLLAENSQNS